MNWIRLFVFPHAAVHAAKELRVPRTTNPIPSYGSAVIAVALAILLTRAGGTAPVVCFLIFMAASAVASWFGGRGPGLGSVAAGALVGLWISVRQGAAPWPLALSTLLFLVVGSLVTVLIARRGELKTALAYADARLQAAQAVARVAVWAVDRRGVLTYRGGAVLDSLHIGPDEATDRPMEDRWQDAPALLRAIRTALHGETTTGLIDVGTRRLDVSCAPVRDARGTVVGAAGAAVDQTDRLNLEEQLRQAQKMEALGQLTGGIAHDFNNILTAILGYSDMTLAQIGPDKPIWKDLKDIHQAATRAASLTRQLLAFSRKQQIKLGPVDLNGTVRDIEKMLRRLIGEDIAIQLHLASDLGVITADTGQLEQVLMNLAVNARDAMSEGGRLTIATSRIDLADSYVADHPAVIAGPYVQLTVADTGCGMDARTRARLFEPFFTTKEPGKGTGLGLATVYSIVKQFGGYIWVYSEPGMGTTFKIHFPELDVVTAQVTQRAAALPASSGSENVLLVEDEDSVRAFAAAVLKRYGYHVLEASTPAEAVVLAECLNGPIHLVLTDIVMPGMNGAEMVTRLRARRPDLNVLYMSGYPEHVVRQGILDASVEFLEKPFTSTSLLHQVRAALDGSAAGPVEPHPESAASGDTGGGRCVWVAQ
ncbi:MAG TPA: ATP-binding protein [Vicinamibacterales bacterium]|nr:ATP-binding protein [Vicinamibacterales bacterium]